MNDKLFLIAIGGTGMRCLEAFVHLCAAGLFDNKTIEILTLDTDQTNGNKGRVEQLIELYNKVKTNDSSNIGGEARANTFFSAKLNLYRFYTDYSKPERKTLRGLSSTPGLTNEQRDDDQDLADLMFDPDSVQGFELDHGYRAQTHLGSMLMYHGIVEAALNSKRGTDKITEAERDLKDFLKLLNDNASSARVFVFGSVFGGTGASSIPVIPIALREAIRIISGGNNVLNLSKVKFGSTLLTDYFTFDSPDNAQRNREKVIADAGNFAFNSQAALSFYNNDSTVKRSYKKLYHIGWPVGLKINYSEGKTGPVITGGNEQRNDCHLAELMCATAAYDFFNTESFPQQEAEYVYRTVEESAPGQLRLTGASFVGAQDGEYFENKLGALLSLSHLLLGTYGGAFPNTCGTIGFLNDMNIRKIYSYESLTDEQAREIDEYLKVFAYSVGPFGFRPGWLFQIFRSAKGGQFIFAPEAFNTDISQIQNNDPGGIFLDGMHNWETKGLFGSTRNRRFDKFTDILKQADSEPYEDQGQTVKELFLAHLYNAITSAQNFFN